MAESMNGFVSFQIIRMKVLKLSVISEGILNEAGLSRIVQLVVRDRPFAVVTAFRDEFSLAENRARNRELEGEFCPFDLVSIKLIGHWLEAPDGTGCSAANADEMTPTVEESFFVPMVGDDFDFFSSWVLYVIKKFDQDAAILSNGAVISLMYQNSDLEPVGTGINVGEIQQAYSSLRGRDFVFEGTMRPSNIMHRMALKARGIYWV